MKKDTIYALSTVVGKAGVAIIRIAGPDSKVVLEQLSGLSGPSPRRAYFCSLRAPESQEVLDEAVFIYFEGPKSFTGDDIVELHLHGSVSVVNDVLEVLSKFPCLRLAEPGEFSKRAFLNGKMDLTRAEGLASLIDAETSVQRRVALRQLSGELEQLYDKWRNDLIAVLALLEAFIDFPDDDVPQDVLKEAAEKVAGLNDAIKRHLQSKNCGEVIARGINIAIVGAPNVGKSTLLNLLSKRDIAIVSNIAGTTRDVLQVKIDLKGYPVVLYDTAGIRETDDVIEREGVRRAKKVLDNADIQIAMLDASNVKELDLKELDNDRQITVLNKSDLSFDLDKYPNAVHMSALTGEGVEDFLDVLLELISVKYTPSNEPMITKIRYRKALESCVENLNYFSLEGKPLELAAEDVRLAANSIGSILGKVDVEEILDLIFSSFCIGK